MREAAGNFDWGFVCELAGGRRSLRGSRDRTYRTSRRLPPIPTRRDKGDDPGRPIGLDDSQSRATESSTRVASTRKREGMGGCR